MTSNRFTRSLAALAGAVCLFVTMPAAAQATPQKGGTLVIVVQPEPPSPGTPKAGNATRYPSGERGR